MKGILIAGGSVPPYKKFLDQYFADVDFIACADSGINIVRKMGYVPNLLIGDMDSLNHELLNSSDLKSMEIIELNPDKDYSDTYHAIDALRERGVKQLTVLGALGSRADHSLSNIFTLEHFIDSMKIKFIDGQNSIELYKKGEFEIDKDNYEYLSIFCLSDQCKFSVEDVKYEVHEFENSRSNPIGLSNEILGEKAKLIIHHGIVIVVQSNDEFDRHHYS